MNTDEHLSVRSPGEGRLFELDRASELIGHADFIAADQILERLVDSFPRDARAAETYATSAARRRDWRVAAERWRAAVDRFPDEASFHVELARSLCLIRRSHDGDEVIVAALRRFPDNLRVLQAFAHLPQRFGRPELALERWALVRDRKPNWLTPYVVAAEALRRLGRFRDAETLLSGVPARLAGRVPVRRERAWIATHLEDWPLALDRWASLLRDHPGDPSLRDAVGQTVTLFRLAQLEGKIAGGLELPAEFVAFLGRRAGGSHEDSPESPDTNGSFVPDRELMMQFEGLGDQCEFGLVQRYFGAEPVSLLRWAAIRPPQLVAALNARFDGLGQPDNTFVKLIGDSDEYFAGDKRWFRMHTFQSSKLITEERMFETMCRRLRFLRDKLLQDLEEGEKFFVYKKHIGDFVDDELESLVATIERNFSRVRLLVVRRGSEQRPPGTMEQLGKTAYVGYVSRLTNRSLDRRFILYDEWMTLCRRFAYLCNREQVSAQQRA